MNLEKEISFIIHNEIHSVKSSPDIDPETSLNTYLRDYADLKGTKGMCYEGGCGACLVAATVKNPITKRDKIIAVNSCLIPILACHGWNISTIEGIGNRQIGYHKIQETLAKYNGTQCGYCSAGMVMNMYALYEANDVLTKKEVEDAFGGNLCRCTGYRPILDAFKSLCSDADQKLKDKYPDIEDLKLCSKTGEKCNKSCHLKDGDCSTAGLTSVCLTSVGSNWYKIYTIASILELFQTIGDSTYIFAAGNTAKGVFKVTNKPSIYIDITSVPELISYKIGNNLVLGANISLNETMTIIYMLSMENTNFWYLQKVYKHIDLIANVPVRNVGTLAGNLSMKHDHHEFPSDIFLLLETLGTQLTIVERNGSVLTKSVADYLNFDMNKCIMKSITLPPLPKEKYIFRSYKITPRFQNAHAYVNAAFLIELEKGDIVKSARIVYGGINPNFVHASATEKYLVNRNLYNTATLQGALQTLNGEIVPDYVLPDATPKFRKNLALALFYKFVLSYAPKDKINVKYVSGGYRIQRPLSSGHQEFTTNKDVYPLTQPVNKVEGLIQCAGEIQYINDIPAIPGQVFAAFVLAETMPLSTIKKIDPTAALAQPGVVAFISSKDVPGLNSFTPKAYLPTNEEIFCSGQVAYNGQPVGLIIANTHEQAINAVNFVKVDYEKSKQIPLFNIIDVLKSDQKSRVKNVVNVKATKKGNNIKHTVKGNFNIGGQYHFTMETHCCVCDPTDDGGMNIYAATQWVEITQMAIAVALKIPQNKINVSVRRLGGAYGVKILRAALVATATAVAAYKLNRAVRISVPLTTNMKMIGKRAPAHAEYDIGVDDEGVVQYMNYNYYHDYGISGKNESSTVPFAEVLQSCYVSNTWNLSGFEVQTDMAGNCYCRAPGSCEAITMIEHVMDHISIVCKKDATQVRLNNIATDNTTIRDMITEVINWGDYNKRKTAVQQFNANNRWMKKGISLVAMKYPFEIFGTYSVFISVYAGDGTVAISHGGIECGQGINTKVTQVCAHMLNIPMSMISIKATNSLNCPNNMTTGGSITSEACCYATIQACNIILNRLEPVKQKMQNPTWSQLVLQAHLENVELCATSMFSKASNVKPYDIFGVCIAEVDVDILTGQHNVIRVDLIEDTGASMSPEIDVGQVEGAFVMGMGHWTCEKLVYDDHGGLLTNSTWTYKIPGVKEIPDNFNVMFQKNSSNPVGVFNSKATGEPPLCLSSSIPLAIRQALASARSDAAISNTWVPMNGPTTVEYTFLNGLSDYKKYIL